MSQSCDLTYRAAGGGGAPRMAAGGTAPVAPLFRAEGDSVGLAAPPCGGTDLMEEQESAVDGTSHTHPFTVPTTRGDSDVTRWLTLDPLDTCSQLYNCKITARSTLEGVKIKPEIRKTLRLYIGEPHMFADVCKLAIHVDGGGVRKTKQGEYPATWAALLTTESKDGTRAFCRYICGEVITDEDA